MRAPARSPSARRVIVPSLRQPAEGADDCRRHCSTRSAGSGSRERAVDWAAFYADERRRRVPLPTYPFERQRYWIDEAAEPVRRGERLRSLARRGVALAKDALARLHKEAAAAAPALSATDMQAPSETQVVAPRTATRAPGGRDRQDVLGSRRMSIHDDFFELGGKLAARHHQVIARVNQAYRIDLSLLTMFESPTVAELASCIEAVRNPTVTTQRSRP